MRTASPQVLLATLCAAALSPVVATQAGIAGTAAAGIGALSSVGAGILTNVVEGVIDRLRHQRDRKAETDEEVTAAQIEAMLAQEIGTILAGGEANANALRAEIGAVLKGVDLGTTMLLAAIESEHEQLAGDLLAVIDLLGSGFTEMRFLLQDVATAAARLQREIDERRADTRAVLEQSSELAAEIRRVRQSLAIIDRRIRPDPLTDDARTSRRPRWEGDPYRGLLPFGEADAEIFYGRQRMTTALAVVVAGQVSRGGLIVITGASGAGKSSLLRAGLLPALAGGLQVQGSAHWPRLVMTPSRDPLAELAAQLAARGGISAIDVRAQLERDPGLAQLAARQVVLADANRHGGPAGADGGPAGAGDTRLVVVVDQFEELFTLNPGAGRQRFVSALSAMAARRPDGTGMPSALVMIAVRGDFVDRCAAFPELAAALRDSQFIVEPMTEHDLRLAITGPADAAGLQLEPGLVDTVLGDLRAADRGVGVGVLPLLSQAMLLTWQARDGGRLNIHGYTASGGVDRAVQVSADAFYNSLPAGRRPLARAILRAMITIGRDGQSVRRQVTRTMLSDIPAAEPGQVDTILEGLVARRLVVLGDDSAEIAHDALLTEWPLLRGWLEEDQASWALYGQLTADAAEWEDTRQPDFLYRGIQLTSMQHAAALWAAGPDRFPAPSPVERDFLRASETASRRRLLRRHAALTVGVLLSVVAAAFGIVASKAAGDADQERALAAQGQRVALAADLATGSEEIGAADPPTAAQLAAAAWKIAPTDQARASMLEILGQHETATFYASGDVRLPGGSPANPGVSAVAFSPDGKVLATADGDGTARLWDIAADQQIGAAMVADSGSTTSIGSGRNGVTAVAFSPDGKVLATAAADGTARLWNVATHKQMGGPVIEDGVTAVAFSPDGEILATAASDGTTRLWNVATRTQIGAPMIVGTAPGTSGAITAVAFSPGGKVLATAANDGIARLWNVATLKQIGAPMIVDIAPDALRSATAVAFSPNGQTLATADAAGTAQLWDVADRAAHQQIGASIPVVPGAGRPDIVYAVAFSPDGTALATAAQDGTARLWSVASHQQIGGPFTAVSPGDQMVEGVAFSPDGATLATAGQDGTARLWRLTSYGQVGGPLSGPDDNGGANTVAFSPDGAIAAVGYGDGTVRLWDVATHQQLGPPLIADSNPAGLDFGNGVTGVAFSPGGRILASADGDGKVRLWDVATHRQLSPPLIADSDNSAQLPLDGTAGVAFSPGGKTIATLGEDMTVRIWNVATHRQAGPTMSARLGPGPASFPPIFELAFSPNGAILATAGGNGTLLLWNVTTHHLIKAPRTAVSEPGNNWLTGVAFSPDGRILATAGWDGTVRLWNVHTGQQTGSPITDPADQEFTSVAFSPDSDILATAGSAGTRLWSVTTHQQIGSPIVVPSGTTSVAFSPDGKVLATAGYDGTTWLWDTAFPAGNAGLLRAVCAVAGDSLPLSQWNLYTQDEPYQQACPG